MQQNVKTFVITSAVLVVMSPSLLADGTVLFKTAISLDPVFYSLNGTTATLVSSTGPFAGDVPGFGTISYEIYSTTPGTTLALGANGRPDFTGWNATAVGPVVYQSDGVIVPGISVTLPGVAGQPVEMEVVAYTGALASPTFYGFSGMTFDGGNTVTGPSFTTSTGALGWQNGTGIPMGTPVTPPAGIITGPTGLGSIVLLEVPDFCDTSLLLGAAMLGLGFLARKRGPQAG